MSRHKDDLGDRMKGYEASAEQRLDPTLPIYARLDGRSFSRFTRGMERPCDPEMSRLMIETARGLVADTHARIAFTQSDEISLVWLSEGVAEPLFDARVQKTASILSGLATAHFMLALVTSKLSSRANMLPHFDCRVLSLPSRVEAANMILWRELDARKNAVAMAAQALFSPKQLHGKRQGDMLEMLAASGVDFESYPPSFTRGTFLRRVTYERAFTAEELALIPEPHRPAPGVPVVRSEVRAVPMPPFSTVSNREAVIFSAAESERAPDRAPVMQS